MALVGTAAEHVEQIHRHLYMVKSWTALTALVVFGVITLGILWLFSTFKQENPAYQLYDATISRDCAPWDGMAFTVSIPWREAARIDISIYQPPQIMLPVLFSFPDETLSKGNALFLPPAGFPEQLTGKVFFERVAAGKIVEGRFELISERGVAFRGKFQAEWENQPVYCG